MCNVIRGDKTSKVPTGGSGIILYAVLELQDAAALQVVLT